MIDLSDFSTDITPDFDPGITPDTLPDINDGGTLSAGTIDAGTIDNGTFGSHTHNFDAGTQSFIPDDIPVALPEYDPTSASNLISRYSDPLGAYTAHTFHDDNPLFGRPDDLGHLPKPELSADFTPDDIRRVSHAISDALHWDHISTFTTDSVPNAACNPGIFRRFTFDDFVAISPEYAHDCINHIGGTDIVISDLAHELGHSMALNICGDLGTNMNERLADLISGFADGKLGVDIDAARQWFEYYYDPVGQGDYPISDTRWELQMAGQRLSEWMTADQLQEALRDSKFLEIVKNYTSSNDRALFDMAMAPETHWYDGLVDFGTDLYSRLQTLAGKDALAHLLASRVSDPEH